MTENRDPKLQRMAQKLRRHSLEMTAESASGHPTTCMSCAEIMSVLFFEEMRWDPKPGSYEIMTRATDEQGNTQPDAVKWNTLGYLYCAVVSHPVTVS